MKVSDGPKSVLAARYRVMRWRAVLVMSSRSAVAIARYVPRGTKLAESDAEGSAAISALLARRIDHRRTASDFCAWRENAART